MTPLISGQPFYVHDHVVTNGGHLERGEERPKVTFTVYWHAKEGEYREDEYSSDGFVAHLDNRCVPLRTIAIKAAKAMLWLKELGALEDREDFDSFAAVAVGVWVDDIVAHLLRAGWYYGCKINKGAAFNRDLLLALHAPGTPDICLAGTPLDMGFDA
jgi:hypothetical protein